MIEEIFANHLKDVCIIELLNRSQQYITSYIYGFKWISTLSTSIHRLAFPLGSKGSRTVSIPEAMNSAPDT